MREPTPCDYDKIEIGMIADPLAWASWPAAKAMLDPALMQGDEAWEAVEPELAGGSQQLWVVLIDGVLTAAAVTRVALMAQGEVAEVYLVGGTDSRRWLGLLSATIEGSAREIGCVGMRAYGREGWKKPLGQLGWRVAAVVYEKAF